MTQALQIVLVALAVGVFFMAFGALVVPADVIESWTGTEGRQVLALSGLYYSVAVLTDKTASDSRTVGE